MKKVIKNSLLLITTILLMGYIVEGTAIIALPGDTKAKTDTPLIKTHWQQMGGFETCTPDHLRLGCWSTALAQIVYYHQLKPFGHVEYVSRKGYQINVNIDSTLVQLDHLQPRIDSTTSKPDREEMARYNYYAALAVEKDFGTDSYMHKLAPASLLEQHYKMKVARYISWHHILPYTSGKLKHLIKEEIAARRPLFLHFTDLKTFGHSVVIDGYKEHDNQLMVHLNQGQGGPQDGWYDFDKDILIKGDDVLRVIYTIRPI